MFDRMSQQFESSSGDWNVGGLQFETMSVDVADHETEFVVTADLPGFEKSDMDIRLTDDTLKITAHSEESEETGEEGEYIRRERNQRSVNRSITLPETVDDEAVEARYKNGVLTVTLPKAHIPDESRSIDIE